MITIKPTYHHAGEPFRNTWSQFGNIDQFRWLVRGDVQQQLRQAYQELGLRHLRSVGMFDDEMRVLGIDPTTFGQSSRRERYNWQVTDYVIDTLIEIGIAPVFCTTFVPSALKGGDASVFTTKSLTSPPRDSGAWADLVASSVRHAMERYGKERVRGWYYEVWNEPNLMGPNAFWGGTQEEYFHHWKTTFNAIKSVDPELRVGGPSTARSEWIGEFLDFSEANACQPDYVTSHIYNNDSEASPLSPFEGPQEAKTSKSPHFAAGVIRGVRALLTEKGFRGELHFNEWGRSWLPCDAIRETAAEAAFIVKTLSEVSQDVDAMAYWCLSDIYDQVGYGAETFHGNYGLLNLQGLRKPSYHAFQLMNRLGSSRICSDTSRSASSEQGTCGAICTTSDNAHQILLYHYDPSPEGLERPETVRIALPVGAKDSGIRVHVIDASHNNIVTLWKRLGSPAYLNGPELATLKAGNILAPAEGYLLKNIPNGEIFLELELNGSGIALVEIS
jgi:xylan 1,4-beta-xylosidase